MKNLLYLLLILPFALHAQSDCTSPKSIGANDSVLSSGWYTFTSSEDRLSILVQNKDAVYQLYEKSTSCSEISAEKVLPLLTNESVIEITPAKMDLAMKTGRCFCDNCLRSFHKHDKPEIFVGANTQFLLHIESATPTKVKLIFKNNVVVNTTSTDVKKKKDFSLKDGIANLDTGQVYILKHVRFVAEQDIFIDYSATRELDELAIFLKKNPTVRISINGHVNGPGVPNNDYYQNLSEARTHRVQMFLMNKGIRGSRLNTKGFGNTQMIFPAPNNEAEAEANRRVEIVIIAK
jgi:outer membrane protein OmpA-like peptidoglycan-associated protein